MMLLKANFTQSE